MSSIERMIDEALKVRAERPKEESKAYLLSSIIDLKSGEKIEMKSIVKKNHFFKDSELQIGSHLDFKDVDHPFGYHHEGVIEAVRTEVIRKREYIVLTTDKKRDYYITLKQKRA